MKVYSIEKREYYFKNEAAIIMHHNLFDVVSSKKKVIEALFYLGVTNQKGLTNKEWSWTLFPEESYTKEFTIGEFKCKDVVTVKEWIQR